jgi:hypothetical protein
VIKEKEDKVVKACNTYEGEGKLMQGLVGKPE